MKLRLLSLFLALSPVFAAEKVEEVSFERLGSFDYKEEYATQGPAVGIPESLRKLDGQEVEIGGFMLPLKFVKGRVREFLLLKDQNACCFGKMPKINEWVLVRAEGDGVEVSMDVPILCRGALKVGPAMDAGVLVGLYLMNSPKVTVQGGPKVFRKPNRDPDL